MWSTPSCVDVLSKSEEKSEMVAVLMVVMVVMVKPNKYLVTPVLFVAINIYLDHQSTSLPSIVIIIIYWQHGK